MDLPLTTYRVEPGAKDSLTSVSPDDTGPFSPDGAGRELARKRLRAQKKRLAELQNLLYAASSHSLLVVLQALDAGGKDGTIRRVMTGVNPQGVRVTSFKAPTPEELAHDFLWRITKPLPARGMIAVYNRSHYEDVLIARVNKIVPKAVWSGRFEMINHFEKRLVENGTAIVKLYLHISKEEQKKRFLSRLENPHKRWKFNPGDLKTRDRWDEYRSAYRTVFRRCSTESAPWYVVPANNKWYRNVVVAQILIQALESMKLSYPSPASDYRDVVIAD